MKKLQTAAIFAGGLVLALSCTPGTPCMDEAAITPATPRTLCKCKLEHRLLQRPRVEPDDLRVDLGRRLVRRVPPDEGEALRSRRAGGTVNLWICNCDCIAMPGKTAAWQGTDNAGQLSCDVPVTSYGGAGGSGGAGGLGGSGISIGVGGSSTVGVGIGGTSTAGIGSTVDVGVGAGNAWGKP